MSEVKTREDLLKFAGKVIAKKFFFKGHSEDSVSVGAGNYQGEYIRSAWDKVPAGYVAVPELIMFTAEFFTYI
ncbi:MAG: hypothetical protein HN590_11055, partial [Calditrichaeota bacterium]|nr:hypothetical protein [Calditrichota bacterium]